MKKLRNGVAGLTQVVEGFDKWMREEKIPPIQRKYHQRTWQRATEVALASVSLALVAANAKQDEADADHHTIMRMGELLAGIAVALKGPEEASKRHGYQDLPQLAQALVFDVAMLKQQLAKSPLPEIVTLPMKIQNANGMAEWADVCTEERTAPADEARE